MRYIRFFAFTLMQIAIITPSYFKITDSFFEQLRRFKENIYQSDLPLISSQLYFVFMIILFFLLELWIIYSTYNYYFPKLIKRDKEYLLKTLYLDNLLSPITTRKELHKRVLGSNINKENKKLVDNTINQTIKPIKQFIINKDSKSSNTLIINSKWGSGKTTSLLIAISECNNPETRYVYESAFKYTNEMHEFFSDLFNILDEILRENKIYANKETKALLENISGSNFDIKQLFSRLIGNENKNNYLSTDIISKLNKLYRKKGLTSKIIVIIDDLDRIQGNDIVKILSVLSILRRMEFVKIILPIDTSVVVQTLKHVGIEEPDLFVQKYLPEQSTINIISSYQFASTIIAGHIQNTHPYLKNEDVSPAVNAIAIKLLSNKMHSLTKEKWSYNSRIQWLSESNGFIIKEYTGQLYSLLYTPQFIHDRNDTISAYHGEYYSTKYYWNNQNFDPRKYENVILNLKRANGGYIKERFTNDDYDEVINTWTFEYMERYWNIFEFTIRCCINISNKLSNLHISKIRGEQFAQVYNRLFENDKQITFDNEE